MTISALPEWSLTARVSNSVTVLDEVASTNTWAIEHQLEPYSVVLSWNQTHGRGRWNRSWISQPGEALALSVVFPPSLPDGQVSVSASWIPLLAGTSAVRSLAKLGIEGVAAKWPNDIVCEAGKLGGILTEVDGVGQPIIGLGLNVQFSKDRPVPQAVSLAELRELEPDTVDTFVAHFLEELKFARQLQAQERSRHVRETLLTVGRFVRVSPSNGESWNGFAEGLGEDGALLVRDDHGSLLPQRASEVEHLYQ